MSVIIKGISGYECCADCEFCSGLIMPDDIYVCDCPPTRGMNITRAIEEDCKHPDCQLVELPEEHGRLIDADAMCNDLATVDPRYKTMIDWCIRVTEAQPTIVEAEGEEGET